MAKDSTCDMLISPFNTDFYLPFFKELKEKEYLEVLANIICDIKQTKDNLITESKKNQYQDWLNRNADKVNSFRKWSSEYKWPKNVAPDKMEKKLELKKA